MRLDHVAAPHASELVAVELMAARCPISMFPELRAPRAPEIVRASLVEDEIAPGPVRPLQGVQDVHLDANSLCRRPPRRAARLAHRKCSSQMLWRRRSSTPLEASSR